MVQNKDKKTKQIQTEFKEFGYLNEKGEEVLDPRPIAVSGSMKPALSLADRVRAYVQNELSDFYSDKGKESFEEADDFDVDDEFDMDPVRTQYEKMEEDWPPALVPDTHNLESTPKGDQPEATEKQSGNPKDKIPGDASPSVAQNNSDKGDSSGAE